MSDNEFQPIKGDEYRNDVVRVLTEADTETIADLLVGRKVQKVSDDHLLLDDGTVIRVIGNEGGCGCGAGDYDLTVLNGVDNVITNVEFDYHPTGDDGGPVSVGQHPDNPIDEWTGWYRIFVYADNKQVNLMQVEGTDGNGYYGTGYSLLVRPTADRPAPAVGRADR